MFYLLVKRVYKVARSNAKQFDARTTNTTSITLSGPFTKRATAERSLSSVLGTHTCLEAQLLSEEELMEMASKGSCNPYDLLHTILPVVKRIKSQKEQSVS